MLVLVDPDSDLARESNARSGRVVQLLGWGHRDLAEVFAGTAPAPGGPFRAASFEDSAWGPGSPTPRPGAGTALESATDWSADPGC